MDHGTGNTNYEKEEKREEELSKERRVQETLVELKKQFGKNTVLKAVNLEEDATTVKRNKQIGGHKA